MFPLRLSLALAVVSVPAFAADPPEPKFRAVTIDDKIQIGYGVAVADVDGDGKPDVLLADKKQFVWYRNPTWEKFVLAENLTEKDNVCLAAQDLDGDGKCEIAVGGEWNPGDTEKSGAVFYLIPPADRTQKWTPVKLHAEPTTHRMRWSKVFHSGSPGAAGERTPPGPQDWALVVVPLHGRGNKNGAGAGVRILRYRPPGAPNNLQGEWKTEFLDDSMHLTHNFQILGSDGTKGFLLGGKEGLLHVFPDLQPTGETQWRRNSWAGERTAMSSQGVGEVRIGKIGTDGQFAATVEPMHGHELVVYLDFYPGPADSLAPKVRRVLTDQMVEGHALACGNFLRRGDDQIVVGWRGNPQKPKPVGIKLFTPLDAKGEKWRESLIDDDGMACEDLVLADLNADGKLDIVAAGRATKNVKLYFNETPR